MNNKVRSILSIMVSVLIIFSFVACSGNNNNNNQNNSQNNAEDTNNNDNQENNTADSNNNEANNESDTEETIILTLQTWNPGQEPMDLRIKEDFSEKNPGLEINYVYVPYSDHIQKLKIDLASGQGPDIYGMQMGAVYKQFRDFQMPLSSYIEEAWGENWKSKFLDFTTEALDEGGEFYGLPLGMSYAGFVWADVAMLDSYGLSVPKSLSELKTVSTKLREEDQFPLAIGAKDDWINIDMWMNIANDINSDKLYSAIENETSFEDEDLVKSFEIWQSLFTDGIVQDGALGVNMYEDTTSLFEEEASIPMITNGSWAIGNYVSGNEVTYENFNSEGSSHEIFLVDWNDDGKVAPITATIDVVLTMNKDTEYPEETWKLMDYMIHYGQDILINEFLYYVPSRTDLVLDVDGMSEEGLENLEYVVEQSKDNVAGYRENPYPELKQAIANNLKALALEEVTAQEAASNIQKASEEQER